jgi:3-hydroxyacyl-CoA dehydrogenase
MTTSPLMIRKAAVLGAGVMGAQIAAHLTNCGVPVLLFDLPAREGDPNGIVRKALEGAREARARAAGRREGRCGLSTWPTTAATSRSWPSATW